MQCGFERQEARDLIIPVKREQPELPFDQGKDTPFMGVITVTMEEKPKFEKLPESARKKINFDAKKKKLSFKGVMTEKEQEEIKKVCATDAGRAEIDRVFSLSAGSTPVEEKRTPSEEL
ncbi:MAG: hypothetical protein GY820_29765 [Gammaproteobacteria bacterium]|nr:hypothetical protein [Gammaproteobacteria bacterium]